MACDSKGNVYVTQSGEIRDIDPQGTIQEEVGAVEINGTASSLNNPTGIAIDPEGRLVFSEASLNVVIRVDLNTFTTTVIAGTAGSAGFGGDGSAATSALLNSPGDSRIGISKGNLYIADRANGAIRQVSPTGVIQTIAGADDGFSHRDIRQSRHLRQP